MSAILPSVKIDSDAILDRFFLWYQVHWIQAEDYFHARGKQCFALAEKSVRIGWTYPDAFKNVRKRLRFRKRDYLFATKDYPSALEYMRLCYGFADLLEFTRAIISHGEDYLTVPRLDPEGKPTGFTDEIKVGLIKFDNGSRIIAFSSNPRAMAVHAGDVGLDEFAKHPNARLLWETAQGRVTWGYDMAVWSAHDGEDTLFNEFAREARAGAEKTLTLDPSPNLIGRGECGGENGVVGTHADRSSSSSFSSSCSVALSAPRSGEGGAESSRDAEEETDRGRGRERGGGRLEDGSPLIHQSTTPVPTSPWNLYYRVTIVDAIEMGLLKVINRVQKTKFTPEQFVLDCQTRARTEETYQQAYMCNPLGAAANHIVEWSAIEHCRYDYKMIRVHFEHSQIIEQFGEFTPMGASAREQEITDFVHKRFLKLFQEKSTYRLGFDVAASGQGNLAVIYIDERKGEELWLRALFTCRTEDWNFLRTVLFKFLRELRSVQAAGDESGLGRQICWEARQHYGGRFTAVNFSSKKHDLGFALMNQLATAQKRFPRSEQDIAADYFALRKFFKANRWVFSEAPNRLNPASHCDIAWAGALATHAHSNNKGSIGAAVGYDNGWFDGATFHPWKAKGG